MGWSGCLGRWRWRDWLGRKERHTASMLLLVTLGREEVPLERLIQRREARTEDRSLRRVQYRRFRREAVLSEAGGSE